MKILSLQNEKRQNLRAERVVTRIILAPKWQYLKKRFAGLCANSAHGCALVEFFETFKKYDLLRVALNHYCA